MSLQNLNAPAWTQSYAYDAAGNLQFRTNNAMVQTLNVDSLNQLTTAARTNTMTVAGLTTSAATNVTVNGSTATRYGDNTFAKDGLSLSDGTNTITAIAQDSLGRADTNSVSAYLPATATFAYDGNGNLTSDGRRAFEYDVENQLTRITVTNSWKSEFTYDALNRRRVRKEYTWQNSAWVKTEEVRYIYDGRLVIQERNESNLPTVNYTRGRDVSGSLGGAGGIGGLLAMTQPLTLSLQHFFYHADGNGNVSMLLDASQDVVARYLYDPYGNLLAKSGSLAAVNLYRFSSKEVHLASGLLHYLYRYYDPALQCWITKDPVAATGQLRPYTYADNEPLASVDPLGLTPRSVGIVRTTSVETMSILNDVRGVTLADYYEGINGAGMLSWGQYGVTRGEMLKRLSYAPTFDPGTGTCELKISQPYLFKLTSRYWKAEMHYEADFELPILGKVHQVLITPWSERLIAAHEGAHRMATTWFWENTYGAFAKGIASFLEVRPDITSCFRDLEAHETKQKKTFAKTWKAIAGAYANWNYVIDNIVHKYAVNTTLTVRTISLVSVRARHPSEESPWLDESTGYYYLPFVTRRQHVYDAPDVP